LENVELPMIFQGTPRAKRMKRAKELLERVRLGDRMGHRPAELSGGEQQRVAIARALVNDPDIILADEPTGNLDSESGEKIIQLLQQLNEEEHKTIILVTHDPEAAKYAARRVQIKDGKFLDQGL
jgi:putative ABC transport system ATP-binding protein